MLIVKSLLISCMVVLLTVVVFRHEGLLYFGRLFIALTYVLALGLTAFYRTVFITPLMQTIARRKIAPRRLLVVGGDAAGRHVAASFEKDRYTNFHSFLSSSYKRSIGMFRNQPLFKRILFLLDFLAISVALLLAFLWGGKKMPTEEERQALYVGYYVLIAGCSLVVSLLCFKLNNLYNRNIVVTTYRQLVLLIKSLLTSCMVVLLAVVVFKHQGLLYFGRLFIALIYVLALGLTAFYRTVFITPLMQIIARRKIAPRRLLIVGADAAGRCVATTLECEPDTNFRIVGFLDDYKKVGAEIPIGDAVHDHLHNLGRLKDLDKIVKLHFVDEILIAIDKMPYERLIYLVENCMKTGKIIRVYSDFFQIVCDKINLEYYADVPVIMFNQFSQSRLNWKIKRLADIVLSATALLLLSPVFVLIAVVIKLSSPGPVFYKQIRIGKDGRPFDFYKFRSMHVGGDNSRHKEFVQDFITCKGACAKQDKTVFKITDDPRVFAVGAFLRKTSLDEFPQFFNVLKGDMSLVGPRPCLPYEWDCYDDWHKKRLNVVPGCTGLWQALGRSNVSFEEMVILDLYYQNNVSIWLDLQIMLQTVPVLLFGKGGH